MKIKAKISYGVHAVMNYHEHLMLKCQEAAKMFTVDFIPEIINERDFKRYVAESREFIGVYIEEDEQQTKKLDEHLELLREIRKRQQARKDALDKIKQNMKPKEVIKKVMSELMLFEMVKIMYNHKLSEIIFGLILGNCSARLLSEKNLIKEQLTVSVVPLLLGSFY